MSDSSPTTQSGQAAATGTALVCREPPAKLVELFDEINGIYDQCESARGLALDHADQALDLARQAGALLIDAKDRCNHGEWRNWLKDNFRGSERTATDYMWVANNWPKIRAKRQSSAVLSIAQAKRLLAPPKKVKQVSVESAENDTAEPEDVDDQPNDDVDAADDADEQIDTTDLVCSQCGGTSHDDDGCCVNCNSDDDPADELVADDDEPGDEPNERDAEPNGVTVMQHCPECGFTFRYWKGGRP